MLDTLEEDLSQELIKQFHYELKSGVFEDRANGYAIGDYKQRPNMVGMYKTVLPKNVAEEMEKLLSWYAAQPKNMEVDHFIILDDDRTVYIEALKEFRENGTVSQLTELLQKEAEIYYKQCEYFM